MKKSIFIAAAFLMAVTGFTSCSNDEPEQGDALKAQTELVAKAAKAAAVADFSAAMRKALNERVAHPQVKNTPMFNVSNQYIMIKESEVLLQITGHENYIDGDELSTISKAFNIYVEETQLQPNN
jgi:hypothetical protein